MEQTSHAGFRYEHTIRISASDYVALRRPEPVKPRSKLLGLLLIAIGVAAVVWSQWTAPIGGILMVLAVLLWFVPIITEKGMREEYARAPHLQGPVTFGVSEEGFWVHGGPLRVHCAWSGLAVWQRRNDWLLLQGTQTPPIYLPIRELEVAGVFDRLMQLAREHGTEYGSKKLALRPRAAAA